MADQISFRDLYDDSNIYSDDDPTVLGGITQSPSYMGGGATPPGVPLYGGGKPEPLTPPQDIQNIAGGPRYKTPQMHNPFMTEGAKIGGTEKILKREETQHRGLKGKRTHQIWEHKDRELDTYDYQGLSPDVMGGLSNVFGGTLGDYGAKQFGADHRITQDNPMWFDDWESKERLSQRSTVDWDDKNMNALNLVNVFDPGSIAANIALQHGGVAGDVRPGSVQALTPEMLQKTQASYYDPLENIGREKLTDTLSDAMMKEDIATQRRGFAGSGQRDVQMSQAEKLYRSGYGDLISQIDKLRGDALDDVMERIYSWDELGSTALAGTGG